MKEVKWYTNQKMTWKRVIVLALITAVVTAGLKLIPALNGTSFQDIAVNLECWILFAVYIIINCEKWQEASIKTFVFFLISQPLIYLIQVPFAGMGFGLFQYYKYWFVITVLTLPGAAIAFLVKRKDWLGTAVLSVATGFLGFMTADYFWSVKAKFPKHILSMCFCIALVLFLAFVLLDKKMHRIVAVGVAVVVLAVSLFILKPIDKQTIDLGEGTWTCTVDKPDIADVVISDGTQALVTAHSDGNTFVTFVNGQGEIKEYLISVGGGSIYLNEMD